MRRWIVGTVLALVLAPPVVMRAHDGHAHKVMGTIAGLEGDHLAVKTAEGKTVMVMLDKKTTIIRGTTKLDRTALKTGERVSVDATGEKEMMMAGTIRLGRTQAAAAK